MFPPLPVNSVPLYNGHQYQDCTITISLWVRDRTEPRRRLAAELAEKADFLPELLDRGTCPEAVRAEGIRVHR